MRRAAPLLAAPLLASLLPLAALAETPMTAAEFDRFVTGKTMDYIASGTVFGREVYLPGRKVRWAFSDDVCMSGSWYGDGRHICFVYDGDPEPKCWTVWQDGADLAASFVADGADVPPRQVVQTNAPLACPGPDVGV